LGVIILAAAILFIIKKRRGGHTPANADPILETAEIKPYYAENQPKAAELPGIPAITNNTAVQSGVQELPVEPSTGSRAELPAASPRREVLSEPASNAPRALPISDAAAAPLSEMPVSSTRPDASLVPAHVPVAETPLATGAPESSTPVQPSVANAEALPRRTPSAVEKEAVFLGGDGQNLQSATTGSVAQTELAQLRKEQARIQERKRRLQEMHNLDEQDEQVSQRISMLEGQRKP